MNLFVRRTESGHSLLETLVAAGIFVLISVAMSGVWVMYGKALAKSGEHLAANHLARGVTEGLIANGYDWLDSEITLGNIPMEENYSIVRRVRGRKADVKFNVLYDLAVNTDPDPGNNDTSDRPIVPFGSEKICKITVSVRWRSNTGPYSIDGGKYNNSISYSTYVYRNGLE